MAADYRVPSYYRCHDLTPVPALREELYTAICTAPQRLARRLVRNDNGPLDYRDSLTLRQELADCSLCHYAELHWQPKGAKARSGQLPARSGQTRSQELLPARIGALREFAAAGRFCSDLPKLGCGSTASNCKQARLCRSPRKTQPIPGQHRVTGMFPWSGATLMGSTTARSASLIAAQGMHACSRSVEQGEGDRSSP